MNDELKELLIRLERLSPMPDDDSPELTVDRLREYENVIRQLEENVMHEKERDPSLVMPLLVSFGYGDGFGLYWATLHLLEKFPLAVLQPALREAVLNGHKGTRRWAVYMIGRLRDSNDVSIMETALEDPADEVRYHALMALQMIGDPIALPAMEALLQDDSPLVRRAAQKYTSQLRALKSAGETAK